MADPTFQTFCCHHGNDSHMSVTILSHFDSSSYNYVCMVSSFIGILGSIYQILPRQEYGFTHRLSSATADRCRRIIINLALADLLACIGVFTRSSLWLCYKNIMPAMDDENSVLFCAVSSAIVQYFYMATWIWTLCYAIDMRLIVKQQLPSHRWYHAAAWILPAILTTVGLVMLYYPDANCHTYASDLEAIWRFVPNYIVNYIPILTVMIANPILYRTTIKDVEKSILCEYGQVTNHERSIINLFRKKFATLTLAFYISWLPNLINGLFLWVMWFEIPGIIVIIVWYIMAFTNPLQALLNSIVYRRWSAGTEKIYIPCVNGHGSDWIQMSTSSIGSAQFEVFPQETSPLLDEPSTSHSLRRHHSEPLFQ